ncbi:MAG: carbohydrate ABC transporter permease [Blautia faecis]
MLALLVVYPIAYAFYLSVMDTNLTTKWEFVGLSNYISLLKDGSMINSLKVTFLFTIVVVLGHLAVGTILALAMNKKKAGSYSSSNYFNYSVAFTRCSSGASV